MAEQIAISAAEKAVESLIIQTWREIQYVFNYNRNIKKLREKVDDLENKKGAVKLLVAEAERNAEIIGDDVLGWLKKVDNIKKEANEVLEHTKNAHWGCLYCKCPKLHSRYKLSKQASVKTGEVIELQNKSEFGRIGYPASPGKRPFSSPQEFDDFESRMEIQNDVIQALRDDSIPIIGICGLAGVGKTTLVKEVADKVKTVIFDEVVMAVVSKDPTIANIQQQLAENLGMKIDETTDKARADRLYTRLEDEKRKILVILDDLWKELDLHNIGIPIKRKGLKVLFTSRFKEIWSNVGARIIEVDVLSEDESWHLFKQIAKISEEDDIKGIAKDVEEECGRLPLAIVIVGKALMNKEEHVWRDALHQLKTASVTSIRGMQDLVYLRIKLSYEYLESDFKKLLLLCSLFPEDYDIRCEDLVRYAMGLQLFKNIETMAQIRDRVYSIIDELKSCYLLLESEEQECVKLHDVVRDVCLLIASSDEHMYMVRHGGLKEWPQEDSYSPYTAISLTFEEIDELPSGLDCPKLKLLRLCFREDELHIPEDFSKGMNELKVLELNLNGELPLSLQSLVNLRTLCFDNCRLYGGISIIANLRKLEVLSFYNSHLDYFLYEVVELINLKSLDLRFEKGPSLPSGVLLRLKKLEELYLGSYFQEWKRNGMEAYSGVIAEISSLQNLQSIQFCAYDDYCLEQVLENLHLKKLIRFKITRTTDEEAIEEFQFRKVLTLQSVNVSLLLKPTIQTLLKKTEDLNLRVEGLTNMVDQLDVKGFVNLKKLNMKDCDLKYLVDATNFRTSGGMFVNLEELDIRNANNLEELCHGNLPVGSFVSLREMQLYEVPALRHLWGAIQHPCLAKLRILEIKNCGSIRSLFLQSSVECLRQLQKISISECPMLETLISNDEADEENTRDIEFLQLEILELERLESFRCFNPKSGYETLFKKVMLPNLKTLKIIDVDGIRCIADDQVLIGSLSKLQTMGVYNCDGLQHVAASESIKRLQSLEMVEIRGAKSLEVVFDFTGLNVKGANIENLLGQLQSLDLTGVPNLKHVWRMLPKGIHAFKNLRSLKVWYSDNLRYLLSPSMATMLVGLETLDLVECEQMEAIIGMDERPILEIESDEDIVKGKDGEESTNKIVFPKLRSIGVTSLRNFQIFCSENIDLELPPLTTLKIISCPRFDLYHYFYTKVFTLVDLVDFHIEGQNGIRCILDDQMPIGSFSKLRTINVDSCDDLQHVAASNSIKLLQSLETLQVKFCSSLEAIFDFKGINVEEADMESLLDRLQSLELFELPNLKHIWRMCPKEIHAFKNLRSLIVWGLDNWRYLLLPSMAKMLVGLETLCLIECDEMEAVIGRDESVVISEIEYEEDSVQKKDGEETTHKIQFPKLRRLQVTNLVNFRMLCSENVDLELPSLAELILFKCPKMTKFCVGQLSATRLHNVQYSTFLNHVEEKKNVALGDFSYWLKDCESKIRCLDCSLFGKERCTHFG